MTSPRHLANRPSGLYIITITVMEVIKTLFLNMLQCFSLIYSYYRSIFYPQDDAFAFKPNS